MLWWFWVFSVNFPFNSPFYQKHTKLFIPHCFQINLKSIEIYWWIWSCILKVYGLLPGMSFYIVENDANIILLSRALDKIWATNDQLLVIIYCRILYWNKAVMSTRIKMFSGHHTAKIGCKKIRYPPPPPTFKY